MNVLHIIMARQSQDRERQPLVINEQVLANGLVVGLLTRGPVPWGLSQALVLSPGSGQFKPALAQKRPASPLRFILLSIPCWLSLPSPHLLCSPLGT